MSLKANRNELLFRENISKFIHAKNPLGTGYLFGPKNYNFFTGTLNVELFFVSYSVFKKGNFISIIILKRIKGFFFVME